jgi:Flp pilus assembly pilin Flp
MFPAPPSTHPQVFPHRCASIEVVRGWDMMAFYRRLWIEEQGQDIAEYAVMLAVILVIVVGTIRLVGTNANTVFSAAASSIQ